MNRRNEKECSMNLPSTIAMLSLLVTLASASPVQADSMPAMSSAMHDEPVISKWMLDRLERRFGHNGDTSYWEAQAWIGGDINKLWLKTEGNYAQGMSEDAELEAYYSRAVAAFWDAQIGLRHDFASDGMPARDWLGLGFQGLAPYQFEVDATAYLGDNGRSAIRFKAEYEMLFTQHWVFTPEVELNAYGKDDPERQLGSGVADASLSLRLRYEIQRELAPYLGVMWTQKYAGTADYARASGGAASETQYLVGIRAWW
jgi:copper resistance protein B